MYTPAHSGQALGVSTRRARGGPSSPAFRRSSVEVLKEAAAASASCAAEAVRASEASRMSSRPLLSSRSTWPVASSSPSAASRTWFCSCRTGGCSTSRNSPLSIPLRTLPQALISVGKAVSVPTAAMASTLGPWASVSTEAASSEGDAVYSIADMSSGGMSESGPRVWGKGAATLLGHASLPSVADPFRTDVGCPVTAATA
mmetsp:Transcript_95137/g.275050  ORF Transcript_95137/g.275050 Transcript_95137/m.275050 type:complete len:201 (-) Transcript_95137:268-870(-)